MKSIQPTRKDLTNLSELSLALGVAKKKSDDECSSLKLAFFPYSTSQAAYDNIIRISQVWQKLVFLAAQNDQFIFQVYQQIQESDPMVSNLIRIKKLVQHQSVDTFIFLRNDYFINESGSPKIIEYNLTSVSMAAHSQNFQQAKRLADFQRRDKYVKNEPMTAFVSQLHQFYVRNNLRGILLMIVSAKETNVFEQRQIQIGLLQKGIKVARLFLLQAASLKVDQSSNLICGEELVSIVYYRTGYQISDYQQNPKLEWRARQIIEISNAIKIPTINYDLVNQKRVQVQLSKQQVYSQYLSKEEACLLKQSLVPVWQFDHMSEQKVKVLIDQLQNDGKEYILKPNLEGGGHNIYGKQALSKLKTMDTIQRKKYILMQKIITNPIQNILICCGQSVKTKCIYEVSQYGLIIAEKSQLVKSETCGFLIRIKPENQNEGGIMAGVGSICSWIIE